MKAESKVHTAYNGLDGFNEFENNKNKFDLVITDLIMPLISGTGLIALVKKESPEMPVIAITGWGKHPSELASEAKADVILEKPFELEVLDESISKLLYPNKP